MARRAFPRNPRPTVSGCVPSSWGQHNMEEEPILEHPTFRQALSELGLAAVWVTPGFDLYFRFDKRRRANVSTR